MQKINASTTKSKFTNSLKYSLAVQLTITMLYGIVQLILKMYVSGTIWIMAGGLGLLSFIGTKKTLLIGLVAYAFFMLAALVSHVVYLVAVQRNAWYGCHIAGLIASFFAIALVLPMILAIRKEQLNLGRNNKSVQKHT